MKLYKSNISTDAALVLDTMLKSYPNYVSFYGNDTEMTFEFSNDDDKEAIEAILEQDIEVIVDKNRQVKVKYDEMVNAIYAEMLNVFGTSNDVSAQATASTYEAMITRPANYVGQLGLVDEAAVLAYANSKIADADTYAVFRLNRIAQFQQEKAAILNS